MDIRVVHDVKHLVGFGIDSLQAAVRRQDLQPYGKQEIDLAGIFPQRRKTGSVPRNVECSPDTLFRIQFDLGRRLARMPQVARARNRRHPPLFTGPLFFIFLEFVIRTLFRSQRKIGQRLAAQSRIDKEDYEQGQRQRRRVEHPAYPLPARLLRIVENLFCHYCEPLHRSTWRTACSI